MATNPERTYFLPDELTNHIPVGRTVIYRELRKGTIPSLRIGKRFIIPKAAFFNWLNTAAMPKEGTSNAA